jgi:hypothetical protein
MADPRSARPDLSSIRIADEQEELAEAGRGEISADGHLLGDDDPSAPRASGIDRAICLSAAAAVLAVAGIAAYVSYGHAYAVVRAHGETGITARLEPATIDGLVYASSMVVLSAARHRMPVPCLARWLLGLGIAATLTANMARGWSHGPVGAVVAAWPAASLVGSYELLIWLIRACGGGSTRAVSRATLGGLSAARARPIAAAERSTLSTSGKWRARNRVCRPSPQPKSTTGSAWPNESAKWSRSARSSPGSATHTISPGVPSIPAHQRSHIAVRVWSAGPALSLVFGVAIVKTSSVKSRTVRCGDACGMV